MGYQEKFLSGSLMAEAYVCHLTIAAPKLAVVSGGPAAYVTPVARERGTPQGLVVPLLTPAPVAITLT